MFCIVNGSLLMHEVHMSASSLEAAMSPFWISALTIGACSVVKKYILIIVHLIRLM